MVDIFVISPLKIQSRKSINIILLTVHLVCTSATRNTCLFNLNIIQRFKTSSYKGLL